MVIASNAYELHELLAMVKAKAGSMVQNDIDTGVSCMVKECDDCEYKGSDVLKGRMKLADCQMACLKDLSCKGIDYGGEVHIGITEMFSMIGKQSQMKYQDTICYFVSDLKYIEHAREADGGSSYKNHGKTKYWKAYKKAYGSGCDRVSKTATYGSPASNSYKLVGSGTCRGSGNAKVRFMYKLDELDETCKAMCNSLPSCTGYTFEKKGGVCAVFGSMIASSAKSGDYVTVPNGDSWKIIKLPTTKITGSTGEAGSSCYVKNQKTMEESLASYLLDRLLREE